MGIDPLDAETMYTADELATDLDLQFTCAGLAIGMAAALLTGEEAVQGMVDLSTLWPDDVPDAAYVIGYRVAMVLADVFDRSPEELGALSAHLLTQQQEAEPT